MRDQDQKETELPVELELELKEVDKVERKPRPFVLVEGRKFPNTDALQTQRFGPR